MSIWKRSWTNLWVLGGNARNAVWKLSGRQIRFSLRFSWTGHMNPWRYFSESEVRGLETEFIAKLEKARHEAGIPFIITSGKRTAEANSTAGGVQDSAHLQGRAVDLRSTSSSSHFKIVKGAILAGIRRIGVYRGSDGSPTHIHLDQSTELPQDVMWMGISH